MKNYRQESRESYNRKADHYNQTFDGWFTRSYKQMLLAEMQVNPHDRVLDVGCGNGTLLKLLAGRYPIDGYGADIAEKMIEMARINCPDMTFAVSSCENIPFPDEMFDIITVCVALHHFPDIWAFAMEASRLLKPKGLLYIAEGHLPGMMRNIFNPLIPYISNSGDVRVYSPEEIQQAFAAYGLTITRYLRKGVYRTLIEMRKA